MEENSGATIIIARIGPGFFPYSVRMSELPTQAISVILERRTLQGRWEGYQWSLVGAVPDVGGEARDIVSGPGLLQRLYPGIDVSLHPSEAEGYYLNVSSDAPSVFVALRIDEAGGDPYPLQATLSYNEAARWMDGSERVERASAWRELIAWMGEWVEANYRPEPKMRKKPRSFRGREGQLREKGKA
jgi:hypothetical protein